MPQLGIVDDDGTIRFEGTRQACHAFLQAHGLQCELMGWLSAEKVGGCQFYQGKFHAWILPRKF